MKEIDTGYTEKTIQRSRYAPTYHEIQQTYTDIAGNEHHRIIPQVWLESKHETDTLQKVVLAEKVMTRLNQYMKLGKREMQAINAEQGRDAVNAKLIESYNAMPTKKFKIQFQNCDNINATRLTTAQYEGVSGIDLSGQIERRLTEEGISFSKNTRYHGNMVTYKMDNVFRDMQDEMTGMITFLNRNDGLHSLNLYGGGEIYICANGMVVGDIQAKIKTVHKHEQANVERLIDTGISDILSKMEQIPKAVLGLRNIAITKPEAEQLVLDLPMPKYMKEAIMARVYQKSKKTYNGKRDWDGTLYGLYMAASYVGTHATEIPKSENFKTSLTLDQSVKLQNMSIWQEAWAAREAELDASNAPKIKVGV